eukprot:gene12662-13962_t
MTNTSSGSVKKSLPNQKQRRKTDTRKPKSRMKRRSSSTETPPTTTTTGTSCTNESCDEIDIAVDFFLSLIQKQRLHEDVVLENFSNRLSEELRSKFKGHWYPETPDKGSGYRCIRVNSVKSDSLVQKIAEDTGVARIRDSLPAELTLWIDPGEVSYRIGEEGSICRHYHAATEQPRTEQVKKILTRPRSGSDDSVL